MPGPGSGSFLKQRSGREASRSTSRRWGISSTYSCNNNKHSCGVEGGEHYCSLKQMEGYDMYGNENGTGLIVRKRVMVVVDQTSHSKHAMMWALTHVANNGDLFTLLHIIPSTQKITERPDSYSPSLANSLGLLCKASKPEVEVEALVIQGPKLSTVMSQVKKLEVSVLVLGKKKASPLFNCLCGISSCEEFVEQCINTVDCWTIGVRKQSKGMSGYLITTRRQKDFWLLA